MFRATIYITDYATTRYYGAFVGLTGYEQAVITDSDFFAVLDEMPTANGNYDCNMYEVGESFDAVDTTVDFSVDFSASVDGESSGTLTTTSDATEEIGIDVAGETAIENNHGRAIARRLPTGMAWGGDSIKGLIKGLSTEFRGIELDFNNRASIDNMLYGENLDSWLEACGLDPVEDREAILKQKLTDKSGISSADITAALHLAGFTNLYCYTNKFKITNDAAEFGNIEFGDFEFTPYYRFYSVDPRKYEENIPVVCFGQDMQFGDFEFTQSFYSAQLQFGDFEFGPDAEFGGVQTGADLLVDDLIDDSDKWSDIPDDQAKWYKCFFICGSTVNAVADISESRRKDLRKLLIERKPFKMYGLLFINYTRD